MKAEESGAEGAEGAEGAGAGAEGAGAAKVEEVEAAVAAAEEEAAATEAAAAEAEAAAAPRVAYRCAKCRQHLFTDLQITTHEPNVGQRAFRHRKRDSGPEAAGDMGEI